MTFLYPILLILLSCSGESEYCSELCSEASLSDTDYNIDHTFRYPSNEGNYWQYKCINSTDFSTGTVTNLETISSLKIIINNLFPDSCGNNGISFLKTDSIIYLSDSFSDLSSNQIPNISLDSISTDTLFYFHSNEEFSFCTTTQSKRPTIHTNINPPPFKYPLSVSNIWNNVEGEFIVEYEIIGEETITIELTSGTIVNMSCYVIQMNIGDNNTLYYYLSSIGLVKSLSISSPLDVTTQEYPEGTGEAFTFTSECILIDYLY